MPEVGTTCHILLLLWLLSWMRVPKTVDLSYLKLSYFANWRSRLLGVLNLQWYLIKVGAK